MMIISKQSSRNLKENDLLSIINNPVNKSQFAPDYPPVDFSSCEHNRRLIIGWQIVVSPHNNYHCEPSTTCHTTYSSGSKIVAKVEVLPSDFAHCKTKKHDERATASEDRY